MSNENQLTEEELKEVLEVAEGKIKKAEHPDGKELIEWVYSNDHSENNPIRQLFHLFYDGVYKNRVGIMHCKNTITNEIDTVLVGISHMDGGVVTWPIARVLTEGEQSNYLAPDGKGGYLELNEDDGDSEDV